MAGLRAPLTCNIILQKLETLFAAPLAKDSNMCIYRPHDKMFNLLILQFKLLQLILFALHSNQRLHQHPALDNGFVCLLFPRPTSDFQWLL